MANRLLNPDLPKVAFNLNRIVKLLEKREHTLDEIMFALEMTDTQTKKYMDILHDQKRAYIHRWYIKTTKRGRAWYRVYRLGEGENAEKPTTLPPFEEKPKVHPGQENVNFMLNALFRRA